MGSWKTLSPPKKLSETLQRHWVHSMWYSVRMLCIVVWANIEQVKYFYLNRPQSKQTKQISFGLFKKRVREYVDKHN